MTVTLDRPRPAPASSTAEGIPFGRLLRVEWGKATDTRSARWLIALTLVGTAGLMLVPLLARHHIDQTYEQYLQFAAFGITAILPVVSILTMTTEWTQRTVLTTFTQEPRRSRVIGAKVLVSLVMAAGAAVVGGLLTAVALGVASGTGRDLVSDLGTGQIVGFALFVLVNIMMGVAFGAALHNSAAAIVLFFLLPTVFGFLGAALPSVGHWVDTGTTFNWMLTGEWSGHGLQIAASALLWLVLPLVAGLVRTARPPAGAPATAAPTRRSATRARSTRR